MKNKCVFNCKACARRLSGCNPIQFSRCGTLHSERRVYRKLNQSSPLELETASKRKHLKAVMALPELLTLSVPL